MIFDLDEVNLLSISFRWKSIVNADYNCSYIRLLRFEATTASPPLRCKYDLTALAFKIKYQCNKGSIVSNGYGNSTSECRNL